MVSLLLFLAINNTCLFEKVTSFKQYVFRSFFSSSLIISAFQLQCLVHLDILWLVMWLNLNLPSCYLFFLCAVCSLLSFFFSGFSWIILYYYINYFILRPLLAYGSSSLFYFLKWLFWIVICIPNCQRLHWIPILSFITYKDLTMIYFHLPYYINSIFCSCIINPKIHF